MQQLAAWLAGARHRPILSAAALFLVPLLMPLAAGLMAFVTLHRGPREGLLAALGAASVLGLVGLVTPGGAAMPVFYTALLVLSTAVGIGALMLATRSMSLAFQAAVLVAAALAAAFGMLVPGSELAEDFGAEFAQLAQAFGVAEGEADALAVAVLDVLFGMAMGGLLISVMIALAIGCWLTGRAEGHALLGPQFRGLNVGRALTVAATLVLLVSALSRGGWAANAAVVFLAAFLLQGLAIVHALVSHRGGHPLWLAGVYGLLLVPTPLMPMAGMGLTVVGYLDNWMGLRARGESAPPAQRE